MLLQAGKVPPNLLTVVVTAPESYEAQPSNHETALHIAAKVGHDDVVHALLREGADPNITNIHGDTPLHCACRRNHVRTAQRLLCAGTGAQTPNKAGQTPAAQAKLLLWGLVQTGALRLVPPELLPMDTMGDSNIAP